MAIALLSGALLAGATWRDAGAALSDGSAPSRIVDRTYSCSVVPEYDQVRTIQVGVNAPNDLGDDGYGGVTTQGAAEPVVLVSISTNGAGGGRPTGDVTVSRKRCAWLKNKTIPLSPNGLPGPPTLFEKGVECPVSKQVLLRVRATLERPASFVRNTARYLSAKSDVLEFAYAVRTVSGGSRASRPIAYVAVNVKRESRFYYASNCA